MKEELTRDLWSACAQRDEALAQVLGLQEKVQSQREALQAKDVGRPAAPATAAKSAAAASPLQKPSAGGNILCFLQPGEMMDGTAFVTSLPQKSPRNEVVLRGEAQRQREEALGTEVAQLSVLAAEAASRLQQAHAGSERLQAELAALRITMLAAGAKAAGDRMVLEGELRTARDSIQRQMVQRAEVENSFHAMEHETVQVQEEIEALRTTMSEARAKAAGDRSALEGQLRAAQDYIQHQLVERSEEQKKYNAMKDEPAQELAALRVTMYEAGAKAAGNQSLLEGQLCTAQVYIQRQAVERSEVETQLHAMIHEQAQELASLRITLSEAANEAANDRVALEVQLRTAQDGIQRQMVERSEVETKLRVLKDEQAQELAALRISMSSAGAKAGGDRSVLEAQLRTAQEYIQRQMVERAEVEKSIHTMKDEQAQELAALRFMMSDASAKAASERCDLERQLHTTQTFIQCEMGERSEVESKFHAMQAERAEELAALRITVTEASAMAASERLDLERKLHTAQDYIQSEMVEHSEVEKRLNATQDDQAQELAALRVTTSAAAARAASERSGLERQLHTAQEHIQRQKVDRSEVEKMSDAMKDDLITRLHNTCGQRDEARVQVAELQKEMEAQRRALRAPATLAAAASPAVTPRARPAALGSPRSMATGSPHSNCVSLLSPSVSSSALADAAEVELERDMRRLQLKAQQLMQEKRKQGEERLLAAIGTRLGFHCAQPMAALLVFRCCLQWRAFQADRTSVFDRIILVIGGQLEDRQDDNSCLAYWLTNTVTLLHALQQNLKPVGAAFRVEPVGAFTPVEAKSPALLFRQQLGAFVQAIFPMMRDNVKKQISPMLANCIHTPKAMARASHGARHKSSTSPGQAVSKHWEDLLAVFNRLLCTVNEDHVPQVLVQALFKQLFSFVNVQLFNQLLLRRECCSFSNGEYIETGLAQVESWIHLAGPEFVGGSWDELALLRQAVAFLVIVDKPNLSVEEIATHRCPALSIQQLYRVSTMYWDDKYNTETVSFEVQAQMKQLMLDIRPGGAHTFLLDDDTSLPFATTEVLSEMNDQVRYSCLPLPKALREPDSGHGDFLFLTEELCLSG